LNLVDQVMLFQPECKAFILGTGRLEEQGSLARVVVEGSLRAGAVFMSWVPFNTRCLLLLIKKSDTHTHIKDHFLRRAMKKLSGRESVL